MDDSSNIGYDSDEGVDFPYGGCKHLCEWIVFSGLHIMQVLGNLSW